MVNYPTRDANLAALRFRLSKERDKSGWSYDALAERTGLGRRTLIDLETGNSTGTVDSWYKVAQAFGMSAGEFFALVETPLDGEPEA